MARKQRQLAGKGRSQADTKPGRATTERSEADLVNRSGFEMQDEALEQALLSGDQAALLESYFGEKQYQELRDLERQASSRPLRGGPRVLILPGIMGSKLGKRGSFFDDVLWIDPVDVAAGRLVELALTSGRSKYVALGVILMTYLKLKLRLKVSGFNADFYPYDWRQNLKILGTDLAQQLRQGKEEVSLVAHSMGGLVARAALRQNAPNIGRVIMLGTPNYGSFVPTQAVRGTYSVIRKLGWLDVVHSAEELSTLAFNTFPSLYQLLPAPEKFSVPDLYEPASWPREGPQPQGQLLKAARATQDLLAPADSRVSLIVGINQETVTDLRTEQGHFVYTFSTEGDGTVPLKLALLPGAKTYYIEEAHGSLPNNKWVAEAVGEILTRGETSVLPAEWTGPRERLNHTVTDFSLKAETVMEGRRGRELSPSELRNLIRELASPEANEAADRPYKGVPSLDFVVVGRRRQHRIDIQLALGSITEVDSPACVLGTFRDVAPTGAARAMDTLLEGAIAELTTRRMFSGNVGEIFILPTGRHPVRADLVFFAGLGSFDNFKDEVLQLVAENVIRTFIRTNVEEFATVLLGGNSGQDIPSALQNLISGFFRGLLDADTSHRFRRITLCELDPERYQVIKQELLRLSTTPLFQDVEVTFDEINLAPPLVPPVKPELRVLRGPDPVYLIVRQEGQENGAMPFRSSILTAGPKATVISGQKLLPKTELDKLLSQIESTGFSFQKLPSFGAKLAQLLLADDVITVLQTVSDRHLIVVHDAGASRVPWETLCVNGHFPASAAGLSRQYLAENLSVAKWLEERRQHPVLHLLLIVNPTGDLSGAEAEGKRIRELFGSSPSVKIVERHGRDATRTNLLSDFRSGEYDIIHYAGHAFFDDVSPERSGILCHNRQVLSGADLVGLGNLPSLVFFNACEAARIRRGKVKKKTELAILKRVERTVSLAEAFLRGGVANYLGTYWPVGDEAAEKFALSFYGELLQGQSIGQALQKGRSVVQNLQSVDWADYIHYGNPYFTVKSRQ